MKWDLLSDVGSRALAIALQASATRHGALANNIANVDTPGFIRSDVRFERALGAALRRARRASARASGELLSLPLDPQRDLSLPARADGNNVDIDREMVALAKNALRHQAAGEMLGARIRMLRTAIHGGRG